MNGVLSSTPNEPTGLCGFTQQRVKGRRIEVVIVGNPASRRVSGFVEAARQHQLPVRVVSYIDFLNELCLEPTSGSVVRIESPGECFVTTKKILQAGIAAMEAKGLTPFGDGAISQLEYRRGEIVHPRQWFCGYQAVLARLEQQWGGGDIRWMSTPSAIATTFDKLACLRLWEDAGLPIPDRLPHVDSYDAIRAVTPRRHARLFIKLRYGYSAIGAVALEWRDSKVRAITTVEISREDTLPRLFVSKRPRVLQDEHEIAWLIDQLAKEEMVVESWLPKDRWRGRSYDLRMVTVDQRVSHVVGRASGSPFTNLNLDAQRMSTDEVRERFGTNWPAVVRLAEDAAGCLPEASMLGIDVLVHPCRRRFSLLEANGFGDYLPGLLSKGHTTYDVQLERILARRSVA